jgi:hypothetical protein
MAKERMRRYGFYEIEISIDIGLVSAIWEGRISLESAGPLDLAGVDKTVSLGKLLSLSLSLSLFPLSVPRCRSIRGKEDVD